jgi:hypothetical protein
VPEIELTVEPRKVEPTTRDDGTLATVTAVLAVLLEVTETVPEAAMTEAMFKPGTTGA